MKSYVAVFLALFAVSAFAQQQSPASKPATKPSAPAVPQPSPVPQPPASGVVVDPSAGGQPINIRLDVSVIDQEGTSAGQPKTLMVILADRAMGQARAAYTDRSLSVDARPTITEGLIRVSVTVDSREAPKVPTPNDPFMQPDPLLNWRNSFALLLPSGKPIVALETSDAVTKRKMSIEVKATILK